MAREAYKSYKWRVFAPDAIVRVKGTGVAPARIVQIYLDEAGDRCACVCYDVKPNQSGVRSRYPVSRLELHPDFNDPENLDEEVPMSQAPKVPAAGDNAIYSVTSKPDTFGKILAETSAGSFVVELLGKEGTVAVIARNDLKKVVPYTVQVKCAGDPPYHVRAVPGSVAAGDQIISGGRVYSILKVDTAYEGQAPDLTGHKLLTEPLPDVDAVGATPAGT